VKAPALFNATVTQAERRVVYRKLRFDKLWSAIIRATGTAVPDDCKRGPTLA